MRPQSIIKKAKAVLPYGTLPNRVNGSRNSGTSCGGDWLYPHAAAHDAGDEGHQLLRRARRHGGFPLAAFAARARLVALRLLLRHRVDLEAAEGEGVHGGVLARELRLHVQFEQHGIPEGVVDLLLDADHGAAAAGFRLPFQDGSCREAVSRQVLHQVMTPGLDVLEEGVEPADRLAHVSEEHPVVTNRQGCRLEEHRVGNLPRPTAQRSEKAFGHASLLNGPVAFGHGRYKTLFKANCQ
jgi:hypothetical protein